MRIHLVPVILSSCLISSVALADVSCDVAKEKMRPLDELSKVLTDKGWKIKEIEIDDGCYEVEGTDENGQEVETIFDPETLKVLKTERED